MQVCDLVCDWIDLIRTNCWITCLLMTGFTIEDRHLIKKDVCESARVTEGAARLFSIWTFCMYLHYVLQPVQKKNILNIIHCYLKKGYPILIIFGTNISATTGHQMTIQYSTSLSVCFCTTWENRNRWNKTKKHNILLVLFPHVVRKQTVVAVQNWSVMMASSVKILVL